MENRDFVECRYIVNTAPYYDKVLLFFFILGILTPVEKLVARAVAFAKGEPLGQELDLAIGPRVFLGVVVFFVVFGLIASWAARRLKENTKYQVLRAGVMSLVGAWVLHVIITVLIALVAMTSDYFDLSNLGWFWHVAFLGAFAVPGFWAGWRFGSFGFFWGALGTFIFFVLVVALESEPADFSSPMVVITPVAAILIAGMGGWLGARRFQRSLKADKSGGSA